MNLFKKSIETKYVKNKIIYNMSILSFIAEDSFQWTTTIVITGTSTAVPVYAFT